MSAFVFTTVVVFALLSLVAISQPGWFADDATDGSRTGRRSGLDPPPETPGILRLFTFRVPRRWSISLFVALALFSGWGLVLATFRSLHAPFGLEVGLLDAFLGHNASSILFGAIVGALLALFLTRVFYRETGASLSIRDKAIAVLLGVFFVLGIGGEEAIRSFSQRVSKVSALGTEVAFFEPRDRASGRNAALGDPANAVKTSSSFYTSEGSNAGLNLLSTMSLYLDRDKKYMSMIEARRSGAEPAKTGVVPKPDIEEELRPATEFARLLIEPFVGCVGEVYRQTGDTAFINEHLSRLLPAMRLLVHNQRPAHEKPIYESVAEQASKAYVVAGSELLEFVFHTYLDSNAPGSESPARENGKPNAGDAQKAATGIGQTSKDTRRNANAVEKSCNPLSYLLISNEFDAAKLLEKLGSTNPEENARFEKWTWEHLGGFQSACWSNRPPKSPAPHSDIAEGPCEGITKALHKIIFDLLSKGRADTRPYISIVFASIMAQLNRYEAALVELEDWINNSGVCPTDGAGKLERHHWYCARALSMASLFTEEWLRRRPSVPSVLRDYQISTLSRTAGLFTQLLGVTEFKMRRGTFEASAAKLGFHERPKDHKPCEPAKDENPDALDLNRRAFTALISIELSEAHHALLHPEYANRFSHLAAETIGDLLKTDLSCAEGSNADKDQMRAESLRLYAEMARRDVDAAAQIRDRASLVDLVDAGLAATQLGLEIMYDLADHDRSTKYPIKSVDLVDEAAEDRGTTFLERISTTNNIDTYEALLRVRADLVDARNRLNN